MNILKRCPKCGEEKPATSQFFAPNKRMALGLQSYCRECQRQAKKEKYRDNPDFAEDQREYARQRVKNPETHAKIVKRRQELWQQNLEKNRERGREKARERRKNPLVAEKHREDERKRRKNPDVQKSKRLSEHRREARKRSLLDTMGIADVNRMMEYWNGCCAVCGRSADFWTVISMDHWIPLASPQCPGTIPDNIVPLCHSRSGVPSGEPCCNSSKQDKNPETWLAQRFGARRAKQILRHINAYFQWIKHEKESQ